MAENQEQSKRFTFEDKRFTFEADTNDSDYLTVKRIKLKINILPMSGFKDQGYELDTLDETFKTIKTILLEKEIIKLLPSAQIQLTIQCRQIMKTGLLEIKLCNMDENELFNIEVSLRFDCHSNEQTDVKFFTATLGKFVLFLAPFEILDNLIIHEDEYDDPFAPPPPKECRQGYGMNFYGSFEIVLKVPNVLNSSITAIPKLFSEGEYSDVKIICEDQTFQCHKLILASQSDVFKAMLFTNQFTENITGTVQVDDINAKTIKTVIKYMYQKKITEDEAMDLNLIVAANKYNIVDLVSKCEKIILLTMSMKNIMDILAIAKLLPTPNLFEKARLFFSERMGREKVQEGPKWLKLRTQNPTLGREILESCLNMEKPNGEEEK
jgi:hypothetical protein